MNADLYLLRNNSDEIATNLRDIAEILRLHNVNVIYKTELENDEEKIKQGILKSFSHIENIDIVIIPCGMLDKVEKSIAYKALTGITTTEQNGKYYSNAVALDSERNSFCFFLSNKRIVLLPKFKVEDTPQLISDTVAKAAKAEPLVKGNLAKLGIPLASAAKAAVDTAAENSHDNLKMNTDRTNQSAKEFEDDRSSTKKNKRRSKRNLSDAKENANSAIENVLTSSPKGGNEPKNAFFPTDDKTTAKVALGESVMGKPEKRPSKFRQRFIPMRGDSGKEVARKLVLDTAIIALVIAGIWLCFELFINAAIEDKKIEPLRQLAPETTIAITDPETGEVKKTFSHDWDELKAINKEIVAWIKIDDTNINYPVLWHKKDTEKDQYYLKKDVYGDYTEYGSIFVDYRSKKGVDTKNVILHGHNMLDGSMFQNLMKYGTLSGDLDFYKKQPTIRFDTPDGDQTYKIISVFKTNTRDDHGEFFNYLTSEFASDAEFMNYVHLVRERSFFDTGVKVNEDDQLLTLSTCSYEFLEFRTVVVARKVREGESDKVDVSKAKLNPNPLWPDVYYGGNLSAKPKVTTFSKANKAGDIDWYDGKGKLKGKERMFTLYDNERVEETTGPTEVPTEAPDPTDPPVTDPPFIEVNQISFNAQRLDMTVGSGDQLIINWNPSEPSDKSITWSTNNVAVAKIERGGLVTAVGSGHAIITATTSNGKEAVCEVYVTKPIERIQLSEGSHILYTGNSFKLYVTVVPSDADNQTITWSSSDTSVATVANDGTVTAVNAGTAEITAQLPGMMPISCIVTVNQSALPIDE